MYFSDKNDCPPDWNTLNTTDQCYRIRQSPSSGVNWFSAYHNCIFSQANLAIIDQHQVFDNLQGNLIRNTLVKDHQLYTEHTCIVLEPHRWCNG